MDGDDARRGKVGREQVAGVDSDAVGQAGAARRGLRLAHSVRVEVDANRFGASARGGDEDAAVAAAEVDETVAWADASQIDHPFDRLVRGRGERRVELAGPAGERPALGGEGDFGDQAPPAKAILRTANIASAAARTAANLTRTIQNSFDPSSWT